MKHILPFRSAVLVAVAAVSTAAFMPAMASASCYNQGKSLKALQAEASELKAERDELVITVEDAGDVWEEAEATRGWTAEQTMAADTAKADYDALKDELFALEADLQTKVARLNDGVATYNRNCATKN
ncbi:MAG: hypothetical protein RLN72_14705 [Henriciella sp.]